jgi:hypothetical protein
VSASSPEPGCRIELSVTTADRYAQILVIDRNLNLRTRGQGTLSKDLPPGIYKIRVRSGTVMEERLIVLEENRPQSLSFPPLEFISPVPLEQTARTHEYHQDFATEQSRKIHVDLKPKREPAWLFVLARVWTGREPEGSSGSANPAGGLFLRDADGREVVNLGEKADVRYAGAKGMDPCAACTVKLEAGIYQLARAASPGRLVQTVVAVRGWQTQVFVLNRGQGGPVGTSIHMSREARDNSPIPCFDFRSNTLRKFELARLGLVDERQVLPDETVNEILDGKFQDPMLGILGAHLLLVKARTPNLLGRVEQSLQAIVFNLRQLVGPNHPDVEALALWVKGDPGKHIFWHPPMLRRSWPLVLEATIEQPDLVPAGTVAATACERLLTDVPWLVWGEGSPTEVVMQPSPKGFEVARNEPSRQTEALLDRFLRADPDRPDPELFMASGLESIRPAGPDQREAEIRQLVRVLGVPRGTVEQLLKHRGTDEHPQNVHGMQTTFGADASQASRDLFGTKNVSVANVEALPQAVAGGTSLTDLAATDPDEFRRRMSLLLADFMDYVGIPAAREDELLEYVVIEARSLAGRSVGAALGGWLRNFAQGRGIALTGLLDEEARRAIIERGVVRRWVGAKLPRRAPAWVLQFRGYVQRQGVQSVEDLRRLAVPRAIAPSPALERQVTKYRDEAVSQLSWEADDQFAMMETAA